MSPRRVHPARARRAAVAAVVAVLVAGCSGSSDDQEPEDAVASPTASASGGSASGGSASGGSASEEPAADVGPLTEQPRDTREVGGDGFTLFAPAAFQETTRPGPQDLPMVVLATPSEQAGGVVEVIAFREVDAVAGAREQMTALAASKTDLGGVTDLERQEVEWPGAAEAVLVQWSEPTTTAEGAITQRFAQLAVEVEDGSLVTVVAVAPQEEFDAAGVLEVLRSLNIGAAA